MDPISVFVSSRVSELLQERKDTVHMLCMNGYRPLFFEADPREIDDRDENKTKLKDVVDNLLKNADRLVLLYYLTEGERSIPYNNTNETPIQYEYKTFKKYNYSETDVDRAYDEPVVNIYWKVPDSSLWKFEDKDKKHPYLNDFLPEWILKEFENTINAKTVGRLMAKDATTDEKEPLVYYSKDKAIKLTIIRKRREIMDRIDIDFKKYKEYVDDDHTEFNNIHVARYNGPDFIGLIHYLSMYFFSNNINILHVSHSSSIYTSMASIYVTFKSKYNPPSDLDLAAFMAKLFSKDSVDTNKPTDFKMEVYKPDKEEKKMLNLYKRKWDLTTTVRKLIPKSSTEGKFEELILEIVTIDVPGQIYAVTRVLLRQYFNIVDLVLKPGFGNLKRQRTMTVWISKLIHSADESRRSLVDLELALSSLIGVRSYSIELVGESPYPTKKE